MGAREAAATSGDSSGGTLNCMMDCQHAVLELVVRR